MTNSWYVQLHGEPGEEAARTVAKRNGFTFVSPVGVFNPFPLLIRNIFPNNYTLKRPTYCPG